MTARNTSGELRLQVQNRFIELYHAAGRPRVTRLIHEQLVVEYGSKTNDGHNIALGTMYNWTHDLREHRSRSDKGPYMNGVAIPASTSGKPLWRVHLTDVVVLVEADRLVEAACNPDRGILISFGEVTNIEKA